MTFLIAFNICGGLSLFFFLFLLPFFPGRNGVDRRLLFRIELDLFDHLSQGTFLHVNAMTYRLRSNVLQIDAGMCQDGIQGLF